MSLETNGALAIMEVIEGNAEESQQGTSTPLHRLADGERENAAHCLDFIFFGKETETLNR